MAKEIPKAIEYILQSIHILWRITYITNNKQILVTEFITKDERNQLATR